LSVAGNRISDVYLHISPRPTKKARTSLSTRIVVEIWMYYRRWISKGNEYTQAYSVATHNHAHTYT